MVEVNLMIQTEQRNETYALPIMDIELTTSCLQPDTVQLRYNGFNYIILRKSLNIFLYNKFCHTELITLIFY